MIRADILGGLKIGIARGESLRKAMRSMYNAGYKLEDVEEAAREMQLEDFENKTQPEFTKAAYEKPAEKPKPLKPAQTPMQSVSGYGKKPAPVRQLKSQVPQQVISNYDQTQKNPKGKLIVLLLVFLLIVLLGALIGIFLFKEEITQYFSSLILILQSG